LRIADIQLDDEIVMGAFERHELAACASLIFRYGCIAELSVITRCEFRGRGLGRAVISALCEWGLKNELIVQYEVASSNAGSRKLALSLGFSQLAVEAYVTVPIHPIFGLSR
jgi:RimJ/RimL family protein N-acetyltransferase